MLTPQQVCRNNPCWCGAHSEVKPPDGVKPFNRRVTEEWLAKRQRIRDKKKKKNATPN